MTKTAAAPLPNLQPVNVTVWFHPNNTAFDATLWVKNTGAGPAIGGFNIVFSYSYYDYSQDPPLFVYHERNTPVPASTDVQPGGTNPFVFTDITFVHKPGSIMAPYTFYASVDANSQIQETNENDNNLTLPTVLRPPRVPRPQPSPPRIL